MAWLSPRARSGKMGTGFRTRSCSRKKLLQPLIRARYWQAWSQRGAVPDTAPPPILSGDRGGLLLPPSLHRGWNAHGLAIFRHRPPRDVDACLAQLVDDGIVGQHVAGALGIDQLPDAVAHR